ncbi:MAG: isoprenylcysteine carboxylmethyltransferase family protein [Lewinellaceae bacterium]|nr:isoprenylcysteine carboxylmethyltransferase family protein [Lewinellaceae bacterium]
MLSSIALKHITKSFAGVKKKVMENTVAIKKTIKDSPGVLIPPPIIYVLFYFGGLKLNKLLPVKLSGWHGESKLFGILLIGLCLIFLLPSLWKFFRTRNTLITIKPASSLQTNGIYAWSRNPMYLGLLLLYAGIAFINQNYWAVLILPLVTLIIREYVILREEKYLTRAFSDEYLNYKVKVRRWL